MSGDAGPKGGTGPPDPVRLEVLPVLRHPMRRALLCSSFIALVAQLVLAAAAAAGSGGGNFPRV